MSDGQKEFRDWMNSQSGYIGKENKAAWWDNWNKSKASRGIMQNYATNPGGSFNISGTGEQQQEIAANLSQVGAQTGQNLFQTGQQQQDYYQSLQSRRNGGDAVAAHLMNQRNRNMANMGRQFAGKGVAGGVAGAAMNSAQNDADSSVNASLQKNARQNDLDLMNYVKRQQKVEGSALAAGKDAGLANDINVDTGSGITVICGELHRQGIMGLDIYVLDAQFGDYLVENDPFVMIGYMTWAPYIVRGMRKSKIFSKFIAFFGMAWANEMAGRENILGKAIMAVGMPTCRVIGKLHFKFFFGNVARA